MSYVAADFSIGGHSAFRDVLETSKDKDQQRFMVMKVQAYESPSVHARAQPTCTNLSGCSHRASVKPRQRSDQSVISG